MTREGSSGASGSLSTLNARKADTAARPELRGYVTREAGDAGMPSVLHLGGRTTGHRLPAR